MVARAPRCYVPSWATRYSEGLWSKEGQPHNAGGHITRTISALAS